MLLKKKTVSIGPGCTGNRENGMKPNEMRAEMVLRRLRLKVTIYQGGKGILQNIIKQRSLTPFFNRRQAFL